MCGAGTKQPQRPSKKVVCPDTHGWPLWPKFWEARRHGLAKGYKAGVDLPVYPPASRLQYSEYTALPRRSQSGVISSCCIKNSTLTAASARQSREIAAHSSKRVTVHSRFQPAWGNTLLE
eukprot:1230430-Amphidinium_carterae.1